MRGRQYRVAPLPPSFVLVMSEESRRLKAESAQKDLVIEQMINDIQGLVLKVDASIAIVENLNGS